MMTHGTALLDMSLISHNTFVFFVSFVFTFDRLLERFQTIRAWCFTKCYHLRFICYLSKLNLTHILVTLQFII